LDTRRNTRDTDVDQDRQERRKHGSESVVHTTVFVDLDNLVDDPPDQVHP